METSLHRQLKQLYADCDEQTEVRLGNYRIDAINDNQLIEIQHGSLAAIRDKIRHLLKDHDVKIVKPIIARKTLIKLASKGGPQIDKRLSPKRGKLLDLFDELVYFTKVFPHRRLALEVLIVEVEEIRYPGHGRRRRHRKSDFQVEDQRLLSVGETHQFRDAADLMNLIPRKLPNPFHTGHLAEKMEINRQIAQQIVYCLRNIDAISMVGKQGNAILYEKNKLPQKRYPKKKKKHAA